MGRNIFFLLKQALSYDRGTKHIVAKAGTVLRRWYKTCKLLKQALSYDGGTKHIVANGPDPLSDSVVRLGRNP